MINIAEELKTIYKSDLLPLVSELALKELEIFFPAINLTIRTDQVVDDTFEIDESICSSSDLVLGSCEASVIKFRVANVGQDLTGLSFNIIQRVNGTYVMQLGTYTVSECLKQDDLIFKDITAYDSMKKTDTDVITWYNGLTFPITVKNMRISLLTYLGLQYDDQTLINDSVQLQKTINSTLLLGRDVLKRLCQLAGGFGHFTRLNKFKVIQLSAMGQYPSETLYPAEDLFPAESGELLTAGYKSAHYEEYIVEPITKLQISQEDGDEGVVVGTGDNTYIITENFLLYGKSAVELETIANNILLQIKNKYYRPHETVMVGLPYLEVGDTLTIITSNDAIETFIFQRTLRGIQALEDTVTATGSQKRSNKVGLSTQIQQLKGRTLKIQKNVEELSSTMTDLEGNTSSQFQQTANSIALKVDKAGVISAINLSAEAAKIQAENIQFEGLVTANGNFKIFLDGSIEALNSDFLGTVSSYSAFGVMTMDGAYLQAWNSSGTRTLEIDYTGGIICQSLECITLNGYTPITTNNIGGQSVAYAANSGQSSIASSARNILSPNNVQTVRLTSNDNLVPSSTSMYCGSTLNPWAGGYGVSDWIATSDERKKFDIKPLDERFKRFAMMISPVMFKLMDGTSGRSHCGFIAQRVKQCMDDCGITDMEFAGWIADPVYEEHLKDEEGNELPDFDTSSNIIDYNYGLRNTEFIPLLFFLVQELLKSS
jgi:hypothetical protein